MNSSLKLLAACCAVLGASLIGAQTAPSQVGTTIEAARKVLAERYLVPGVAAKLDHALARAAASGAFRGLSGGALAARVNAEMSKVTSDVHLQMRYQPAMAALLESSSAGGGAPSSAREDALEKQFRRTNAGVRKLEVLPGNIRYLAYDTFGWGTPAAEQAIATAMEFLRHADAIVIDLRNNAGGSTYAEAAIASYFLPPRTRLTRFEIRGIADEITETSTAPFSLAGKPTFVLIGPATVSGAEWFATHASTFGFGTLVGEKTRGGGYTVRFHPLPGGYVLNVSIGRARDAKTGRDLEGVGVAPAISVPQDKALAAAQVNAMEGLLAGMPRTERAEGERLLTFYRARLEPITTALPLADYAGRYGDFTVETRHGELTIRFGTFSSDVLIPIASNTFSAASEPATQIRFVTVGGVVTALEFDSGSGPPVRTTRAIVEP